MQSRLHCHRLSSAFEKLAGAGYFELAGAALCTLAPDSALHEAAAVGGAAIPAPLLLPPMQQAASTVIECGVVLGGGAIEIASLAGGSSHRQVHVTAVAASLGHRAAAGPAGSGAGAAMHRSLAFVRHAAAAACVAARQPAAAVSGLLTATGRSGLRLDPAAFDCFLQLGQVFKAAGNTEVYVPAGLGALRVSAAMASASSGDCGAAWAAAVPLPAKVGTASSDFRLASPSSQTQLAAVSALTAKSLGKAQGGVAGGKAALAQRIECLYDVAWQAADAAAASQELSPAGASRLWRLSAAELREPATAAASAIAAVQRLLKSGAAAAGTGVQLQTVGAALLADSTGSAGSVDSTARLAAAAALSGLVKTLGQEAPQLAWSSCDADGQASTAHRAGSTALVQLPAGSVGGASAFGSVARGGARLAPLLLKSAAVEQMGPHHLFPVPRGSLGSLAALPVDVDRRLGAEEVLVAVKAVGINFRWGWQLQWRHAWWISGSACRVSGPPVDI